MKGLMIAFSAPNLEVPLNYNHQVQSLLYSILGELKDKYHDEGFGNRHYKFFTFSSLRGKKKIIEKKMIFEDRIYLDVRSVYDEFCDTLYHALSKHPVLLFGNGEMKCVAVEYLSPKITSNSLAISMISPVDIHTTHYEHRENERPRGKTIYYSESNPEFHKLLNENFTRKYEAFTGNKPDSEITLSSLRFDKGAHKVVTTYKDIYITAYRGEYELSGNSEYLNFLYYTGLGSRNSAGFGMFNVI